MKGRSQTVSLVSGTSSKDDDLPIRGPSCDPVWLKSLSTAESKLTLNRTPAKVSLKMNFNAIAYPGWNVKSLWKFKCSPFNWPLILFRQVSWPFDNPPNHFNIYLLLSSCHAVKLSCYQAAKLSKFRKRFKPQVSRIPLPWKLACFYCIWVYKPKMIHNIQHIVTHLIVQCPKMIFVIWISVFTNPSDSTAMC